MTMIASPELPLCSRAAADELAALCEAIAALPEASPAEETANPMVRPLPTLGSAAELLRTARRTGDRYGVRLFSRLVDRILDAAHMPPPSDWRAADPRSCAALADILDDVEEKDNARGYEEAEDALRQWAAQSDREFLAHKCPVCGEWSIDCVCRGTRSGR